MEDIKIFFLHHNKLTERKQHVLEQLRRVNMNNFEFIELYLPDELKNEDLVKFDTKPSKVLFHSS